MWPPKKCLDDSKKLNCCKKKKEKKVTLELFEVINVHQRRWMGKVQRCFCVYNLQISHKCLSAIHCCALSNYAWKHCSVTKEYTALSIYIYIYIYTAIQPSNGYTVVLQVIINYFFHKVEQICLNSMDFKYFWSIFKYCINWI